MSAVFFVVKKSGDLRLVIDCRAVNQLFRLPPRTRLVGGAQVGEVWLPKGEKLYLAGGDVQDAFYALGLGSLSDYFGLLPVRADSLGLTELDGMPLAPHDLVYPTLRALPMGFSWSLHLCQAAVEEVMRKADPDATHINDRELVDVLSPGERLWTAYVDNLSALGTDPAVVQRHHDCILKEFREAGLPLHETFDPRDEATFLGYDLGPGGTRIAPETKRVWRFIRAVQYLLPQPKMSGALMEIVLGHWVSLCLVRRELLSLPRCCYSFIVDAKTQWKKTPTSVKRELRHMVSLAPFSFISLDTPYSLMVTASDASGSDGGWGFGCISTMFDEETQVHNLAKYN